MLLLENITKNSKYLIKKYICNKLDKKQQIKHLLNIHFHNPFGVISFFYDNLSQNFYRLIHVLAQLLFTASETELDCYH